MFRIQTKPNFKVEQHVEKYVLSSKVRLNDGTVGKVFSRSPRNTNQLYLYNCHLCRVANLPGERSIQIHIRGRKHQSKLKYSNIDASLFRAPLGTNPRLPVEPAPSGFDGEMNQEAKLQSTIDQTVKSLVGLEYIVELLDGDTRDPSYVCVLCDKRGNKQTIMTHLVTQNHRITFLKKHFPKVMWILNQQYDFNNDMFKHEQQLSEICKKLDSVMGRLKPSVHTIRGYERKRKEILDGIDKGPHKDEHSFPDYEAILFETLKPINDGFESWSSDSDMFGDSQAVGRPTVKKRTLTPARGSRDRKRAADRFDNRRTSSHSRGRYSSSDEEQPRTSRSRSKERKPKTSEKSKRRFNFHDFCTALWYIATTLRTKYKEYQKNPEKHPLYQEELNIFRTERSAKLDATNYNFMSEWIPYWRGRMMDIHDDEMHERKMEIRAKLDMPGVEKTVFIPSTEKSCNCHNIKISDDPNSDYMKYYKRSRFVNSMQNQPSGNNTILVPMPVALRVVLLKLLKTELKTDAIIEPEVTIASPPFMIEGIEVDYATFALRVESVLKSVGTTNVTAKKVDKFIVNYQRRQKHRAEEIAREKKKEQEDAEKEASEVFLNNLTNADLKILLINFTDLSVGEQIELISYLQKLEVRDFYRVVRLRKYVKKDAFLKSKKRRGIESSDGDDEQVVDDDVKEAIKKLMKTTINPKDDPTSMSCDSTSLLTDSLQMTDDPQPFWLDATGTVARNIATVQDGSIDSCSTYE